MEQTVGIIFSNMHDQDIREITDHRTMASVPFGARYRLIDFVLSSFIAAGITDIGVVTKTNYQSLMDHLGSGKNWDLARKRGGLHILPPYGHSGFGVYRGRVEALMSVLDFLRHYEAPYVVLSDCACVCSVDYRQVLAQHIRTGADMTILYKPQPTQAQTLHSSVFLSMEEDRRVKELRVRPMAGCAEAMGLDMYIINRQVLVSLVQDLASRNLFDFEKDFLQANLDKLKVYGYCFEGYTGIINSRESYFAANMDNLCNQVRKELYNGHHPVYTKILDEAPVIYGLGVDIKNSFIADGCFIDGDLENCIVFRGVRIGKGSRIKNAILMQGTCIGENCVMDHVITDKVVTIGPGRSLIGTGSYPVYIKKGSIV